MARNRSPRHYFKGGGTYQVESPPKWSFYLPPGPYEGLEIATTIAEKIGKSLNRSGFFADAARAFSHGWRGRKPFGIQFITEARPPEGKFWPKFPDGLHGSSKLEMGLRHDLTEGVGGSYEKRYGGFVRRMSGKLLREIWSKVAPEMILPMLEYEIRHTGGVFVVVVARGYLPPTRAHMREVRARKASPIYKEKTKRRAALRKQLASIEQDLRELERP